MRGNELSTSLRLQEKQNNNAKNKKVAPETLRENDKNCIKLANEGDKLTKNQMNNLLILKLLLLCLVFPQNFAKLPQYS